MTALAVCAHYAPFTCFGCELGQGRIARLDCPCEAYEPVQREDSESQAEAERPEDEE